MVTGLLRRSGQAGAAGVADEIESVKERIAAMEGVIAEAEVELRDGENLRDSLRFQGGVLNADVAGDIKALDKKQAERQAVIDAQREDLRQLRRYLLSLEEPHLEAQYAEATAELTEHLAQRTARVRAVLESLLAAVEAGREWRSWNRKGTRLYAVARRLAARLEVKEPNGPNDHLIGVSHRPQHDVLCGAARELRHYDRDRYRLRQALEALEAREGS